jgi:hypothetical protein
MTTNQPQTPLLTQQIAPDNPHRIGRPPIRIEPLDVIRLASEGLTQVEIAHTLNCSDKVIRRRFRREFEKGSALCNASLRRKQVEIANKGNPIMLIWLGKQRLGQSDSVVAHIDKDVTFRVIFDQSPTRTLDVTPAIPRAAPQPKQLDTQVSQVSNDTHANQAPEDHTD